VSVDLTGVRWRKSTRSNASGDCVEVAFVPDGSVAVRDTKDRDGGTQLYSRAEWAAFIGGVKAGEFDLPS
jgi:hypothetical protein